ncbi:MAG: mannonate dehydratase [Bacteroidota bacterium]
MLEQTWRWFGPSDPITLQEIRQTGATGIVTALHHVPNGDVWTTDAILERKALIESAGLRWSVIESIPVHEDIKRRSGNYARFIANYCESLRNAAACGIPVVCYNFMPVLDWTRTDLAYPVEDGSEALRFDMTEVAAFDIHILKRPGAAASFTPELVERAGEWYKNAGTDALNRLVANIIAGLPGSEESYTIETFREKLDSYRHIDAAQLRQNLVLFLQEIVPVAEKAGVRLAIHPDDPPFDIFGLPRVVSTVDDARAVLEAYDSAYNGLCFCTGSYGARSDNHLPGMVAELGPRINFLHFRSVQLETDGSFYEANHLEGSANMPAVMKAVLQEVARRAREGRPDRAIPYRPDHGHRMLGDQSANRITNPGYSLYGRMRGLAELRGLEKGLQE